MTRVASVKQIFAMLVFSSAASSALAQDDSFRFFLDTGGADEQQARPAGSLSFTNPTLTGTGRFYVYVQYGDAHQEFSGFNLGVLLDGPAILTAGNVYDHVINPSTGSHVRWGTIPNKNWGSGPRDTLTHWFMGSTFTVGGGLPWSGMQNYGDTVFGPEQIDSHFSSHDGSSFGTTLVGSFDVQYTGAGQQAHVFLHDGDSGAGGITITSQDYVYFGFGDAAVLNKKGQFDGGVGGPTTDPDAYIVPEPATLSGLVAIAWFARNRGRRAGS